MSNITKAEQDAIDRIIRNTNNNKNGNNNNNTTNPYTSSSSRRTNNSNPYFASNANSNAMNDDNDENSMNNNNNTEHNNPSASNAVTQMERMSQDNVAKLKKALQYSNQSNDIADDTSQHLARQKETIERSVAMSEDTKGVLSMTKKTLRDMKLTAFKEKMIKFGIIGALLFIIVMIVYFKFLKRKNS